ncbi:MAG: hypothetical protein N3A66_06475, partial [Planctomycetota bacterium]|nr:hypothetical protein [Planctomycetota bacterium]
AAWLTHIAVYLPVACGLSLALFAMPPNRRQLACLIALGGCGSISYCLAQYTIMVMAGHGALGLFVAGCHLAQIPLANHEAIFVKFFGDLFGLESFFSGIERLWASPPAWLHAALALGKIALAAAIVRLAFLGWRRRRPTGREIYLLLAASCHAGVLAAIIVFLEIRYAMPLLPNLWEPARLMRHLAPLLSLAWLILIQPTGALSPFASACRPRLSSALVLACSLAVGFTALFAARLMKIACGAGQAQPLRLLIERKAAESALPFPSGFAAWQACTAAEALTPRVIFAVNFPPFVAAGENAAIPPPLARLARIGNTQRVFVAVVTAGPAALSSPAAQQRQRQARQMIAVLNLPWLHTCQNGEEVYGRWVDAFAPGALADAAAAVSQEFSAPRRSER